MKRHIPNLITMCNLVCGCIAVRYALQGQYQAALLFIILGAVADFFDGFAARRLGVSSPIGKELDSLADVVTFGFAPSAMLFELLREQLLWLAQQTGCQEMKYLSVIGFVVAAFSALRLAKFNLDERQTSSFIGLPTPANALMIASIVITLSAHPIGSNNLQPQITTAILLAALAILSSILLVSELRLFALKFKNFSWQENKTRYIFLLSSAAMLILGAILGLEKLILSLGVIILWYVVLSLVSQTPKKTDK